VEQVFLAVYLILIVGNINLRLFMGQYLLHNKGICSALHLPLLNVHETLSICKLYIIFKSGPLSACITNEMLFLQKASTTD